MTKVSHRLLLWAFALLVFIVFTEENWFLICVYVTLCMYPFLGGQKFRKVQVTMMILDLFFGSVRKRRGCKCSKCRQQEGSQFTTIWELNNGMTQCFLVFQMCGCVYSAVHPLSHPNSWNCSPFNMVSKHILKYMYTCTIKIKAKWKC